MSWNDPRDLKIDPFGILVGHTWAEVGLILDTINKYEVQRFVEIGIHMGGLAAMMVAHSQYNPDFHYLGVEINGMLISSKVKEMVDKTARCDYLISDALGERAIVRVHQFINRGPGPALIYCDGGDKAREFEQYVRHLREGDLIAAHDFDFGGYARAEISIEDVLRVMEEHNLENLTFGAPYRIALGRKR
ncbi:hypothetical protein LCGC14_1113240 [marine sediment metagenome]|uniref:Uncharacterized protein n=1 Tax=marine sediment metagenome TaxID=412755 RepID=A0A0F9QC75_9ZZZZ